MAERPFEPGGFYHLTSRGNLGEPLFEEPDHHELYLRRYARVSFKYGWTTLDWCLLWNHTHFLVRLGDKGLSDGMRELNTWFARRLNLIHGNTGKGHVFKHRFTAKHIDSEAYLFEVCRYIPLNPQRAGQCTRPDEWRWGGFRATVGLEYPRPFHSPGELLRIFGPRPSVARGRYREHVRDSRVPGGHDPSSNNGVKSPT
jgi:putative transposase